MTAAQGKLVSADRDNRICIMKAADGGAFELVKCVRVRQNPYTIDLFDDNLLLGLPTGQILAYEDIMSE